MSQLILMISILVLFSLNLQAQVLATVGKTKITTAQFNKKYSELKKNVFNPPPPQLFLEDLIKFEIGVQEARRKKLHKDPFVMDRLNQELYKALLEKEIGGKIEKINVTEAETQNYYKKHPEIRTSHILIQFKPSSTVKEIAIAKKRALEIYKEVRNSKRKFSELVKLYSDDNISKRNRGDIGFQSGVTLAPPYYNAAKKLKVGQISKPIRTRFGFHIIKLTGLQSYKKANKRQAKAAVFDSKRKVYFDNYFKKLKQKYSIKKNNNEVRKLKQ